MGFGSYPGSWSNPARSIWLLMKLRDQYASTIDITQEEPCSVASQRLLAEIARYGGGDIERASLGDPGSKARRASTTKSVSGRVVAQRKRP